MKRNNYLITILAAFFFFFQCNAQDLQKPSSGSRMTSKILKATNFSEKTFNKFLTNPKRGTNALSPKKFKRKFITKKREVEGFMLLTIESPRPSKKHIFFLHGGAYIGEANAGHRMLIKKLVSEYNFKVTFIDYPLAPEHTAEYTFSILEKAYNLITEANEGDEFYLFGDSAGGGLALAFLQTMRDKRSINIPGKTVLQSPWLDISMSNPEIENYIEKDLVLSFQGLKDCGKLYAGELDIKNPLVSPIFGSMDSLSSIKVFVSNHELFYPDCIILESKLESAEASTMELTIRNGLLHDWVIMPLKEQDETIKEIADFLLKDLSFEME